MTLEEMIKKVMEENPGMTYEEAERIAKIRKLQYDLPDPMESTQGQYRFGITDEWKQKIRNLKIAEKELDLKLKKAKHVKVKDTITDDKRIVLTGKTKKAKPSLIQKWKNLSKKKKTAIIIGAVVVAGIAIGAAAHAILTGDASNLSNASQFDVSTIADQISQRVADLSSQDLSSVNPNDVQSVISADPSALPSESVANSIGLHDVGDTVNTNGIIFDNSLSAHEGTDALSAYNDVETVIGYNDSATGQYYTELPTDMDLSTFTEVYGDSNAIGTNLEEAAQNGQVNGFGNGGRSL